MIERLFTVIVVFMGLMIIQSTAHGEPELKQPQWNPDVLTITASN